MRGLLLAHLSTQLRASPIFLRHPPPRESGSRSPERNEHLPYPEVGTDSSSPCKRHTLGEGNGRGTLFHPSERRKGTQDLKVHWYPRYVPVDEQRARTVSEIQGLRARGVRVQPIELRGRTIARNFWGRRWCEHLESFSEYAARLAHGRAYVRNGSICHLAIEPGAVDAMVVDSTLYRVSIRIRQLDGPAWTAIRRTCAGRLGSVAELHQGLLSDHVAAVFTQRDAGLFPHPGEIVSSCECEDRATMCKHAAAVLSGVGSRLDDNPELLFLLRGVNEVELFSTEPAPAGDRVTADTPGLDMQNGTPNAAAGMALAVDGVDRVDGVTGFEASAAESPGATDAATPPRRVKKTLTYRPPIPAAGLPQAAPSDVTDDVSFEPTGELVAELREQCGCSIAEFAALLQVTPTSVRRWENTAGPLNLHARPWEALLALHLEVEKHRG